MSPCEVSRVCALRCCCAVPRKVFGWVIILFRETKTDEVGHSTPPDATVASTATDDDDTRGGEICACVVSLK